MAKKNNRFGSIDPKKQLEISSRGGIAVHKKGTGHQWTSEEARKASQKSHSIGSKGWGRFTQSIGQRPID